MTQYPGQYPGQDPDDPFAKPPNEGGPQQGSEETGPVTPAPPVAPPTGSPTGDQPQSSNPWAGYGVPAGQAPPPPPAAYPPPPQPGYAQPAYGYAPTLPNHPQSTTVLVLGLVGLIGGLCAGLPLLVSPFAWVMGARVRREIRESNGALGGDGPATAGFVMGIIGTVLLVLGLVLVVLVVVLIALNASATTSY